MTSKVLSTHCNSGCKNLAMKRRTKVWTGQKNASIWCPYQKKLTRPFWDMETLQCLYWQPWKTNFSVHIFNLRYEESGAIFLIRVSIQLKICKIFIGMAPSKTKMYPWKLKCLFYWEIFLKLIIQKNVISVIRS